MTDWAESHIKIGQLHNKLTTLLNDKKHSEAFSKLLQMQGEVLKLQKFVLYGIDSQAIKNDNQPNIKMNCHADAHNVRFATVLDVAIHVDS